MLYHLTSADLTPGNVLMPQDFGYTHSDEASAMEHFLEKYRPNNKVSRLNAVFLMDNASSKHDYGADGNAYLISTPETNIAVANRSDLDWLSSLDQGFLEPTDLLSCLTAPEIQTICTNYWSGIQKTNNPKWEYRVPSALVLSVTNWL